MYFLGYVLNFFRFGIYSILDYVLKWGYDQSLWHGLFSQDIFQFAGLAMIFTAFVRKIKLSEIGALVVGILLSCIESIIPDINSGNKAFDLFMSTFVTASNVPSHFAFFNWYVFVAAGMVFAQIIRRVRNERRFYLGLMLASGL